MTIKLRNSTVRGNVRVEFMTSNIFKYIYKCNLKSLINYACITQFNYIEKTLAMCNT